MMGEGGSASLREGSPSSRLSGAVAWHCHQLQVWEPNIILVSHSHSVASRFSAERSSMLYNIQFASDANLFRTHNYQAKGSLSKRTLTSARLMP